MTEYCRIKNFSPFCQFDQIQPCLNPHFLAILTNLLDKTWFQKCVQSIFFTILFSKKIFGPKFKFRKKLIAVPPMAILGSKKFRMRATQKCLKVSKIWWYFAAIFLRVSCKFKPTVSLLCQDIVLSLGYYSQSDLNFAKE